MFGKKHNALDDALFPWPDGTPFCVYDMLRSVEVIRDGTIKSARLE